VLYQKVPPKHKRNFSFQRLSIVSDAHRTFRLPETLASASVSHVVYSKNAGRKTRGNQRSLILIDFDGVHVPAASIVGHVRGNSAAQSGQLRLNTLLDFPAPHRRLDRETAGRVLPT
jgi:hypothetical protein